MVPRFPNRYPQRIPYTIVPTPWHVSDLAYSSAPPSSVSDDVFGIYDAHTVDKGLFISVVDAFLVHGV